MDYIIKNNILILSGIFFNGIKIPLLEKIKKFFEKGMEMAGFTPDEGEAMFGDMLWKNSSVDRGIDVELLLFTNVAPGETITEATLTEPTGTGYARINLTDASWTGSADIRSYAEQTFTGGAGGWTGSIQGYAIVSKGTTPRIMAIEVDASGPYTINENDTYKVTPNNRTS